MEKESLKKIESFGEDFKKDYLEKWDREKLLDDWKYSLRFFFEHSFMRGRRDALSIKFKDRTIEVLEKTLFEDLNYDLVNLENKLNQKGVNNKADRKMVIDTINFIKKLKDYNITSYILKRVKENEQEIYNELIEKIKYVGDKITTLHIRDLCWMFEINIKDYKLIFPIDTWLKQIINRLRILDKDILPLKKLRKIKEIEVKEKAIKVCLENNINPIRFNAGIWYIGTHSLKILLDNLDKL